MVGLINQEFAL